MKNISLIFLLFFGITSIASPTFTMEHVRLHPNLFADLCKRYQKYLQNGDLQRVKEYEEKLKSTDADIAKALDELNELNSTPIAELQRISSELIQIPTDSLKTAAGRIGIKKGSWPAIILERILLKYVI